MTPGIHSPKGYHPHNEGFDITDQKGDYQGSLNRAALFGDILRELGLFNQVMNRTNDPAITTLVETNKEKSRRTYRSWWVASHANRSRL